MQIKRSDIRLTADPSKVIMQFLDLGRLERFELMVNRFFNLQDTEIQQLLEETIEDFAHRHRDYEERLLQNYSILEKKLNKKLALSETGKLLLGAYATKEYSIEAAALFNPSIVRHPDQSGLPAGATRFVMSLRSVGEGHISTLSFKQGIVSANEEIRFEQEAQWRTPAQEGELAGFLSSNDSEKLNPEEFDNYFNENYNVYFKHDMPLPEGVIVPLAPSETLGMEDVRLVEMQEPNVPRYLGTYTAYNGRDIQSKFLTTQEFRHFTIHSYKKGSVVQDKGMAFFPRRINGKFGVISRQGGESLSIMFSDDLFSWKEKSPLQSPMQPWEFTQMGNCGSPIETPEGWLMLTHGVGPMRRYSLGVSLLDLENPRRVLATLKEPLMQPLENEREGYVPNVLYTCGWMEHGEQLVIPYAMSDAACSFAMLEKAELINELVQNRL